uniref:ankycorbin-like isoform X1 n=1 Tax=Styela clava TaxID=7725 RepID=UPI001939AA2D|nr:ankycorbin-like isoform X1 [Styela clava]
MKGLKQRLKRPTANTAIPKDGAWSHQDQRVWQAVAGNQPAKVAAKLSKHPDVDVNRICPNVGYSVVHYAAAKGLDDCLNILLAHRADASACDVTGATPLHAAARYGHRGTTSKLLASRSMKVNLSDKNQCTALHFASFEGHADCVKLISETPEVDLNCTDKDGRTPLMVAAAMGRLEVCKELVEQKCDLHHKDTALGHTALTLAADSGHAEVVRLLCENGANHTEALHDGRTALSLAKHKNRKSVINALHIIQLTEAANKSSNGPRLSVSSNKYKLEGDPAIKKRHSVDSILDTKPQTFIDDMVAGTHLSTGSRTPKATRRHNKEEKKPSKSNISRVKAAVEAKMKNGSRRGSDASGLSSTSTPRQKHKKNSGTSISPDTNAFSLYTEGANPHFYEREMKFFDSNSSLDVSSTCSAMNNISKSTDSLRPSTADELDNPLNGTTSTVNSPEVKIEGTDFSVRQHNAEHEKYRKMVAEYEQKVKELEEKISRADKVSIATEKLQKNAEEVRAAQIAAAEEGFQRKENIYKEQIQDLKTIAVRYEKQNKELLRRLNAAQEVTLTVEKLKEQLEESEDKNKEMEENNKNLENKIEKLQTDNGKMVQDLAKEKENESSIITQAKQKIIEAEQRCNRAEENRDEAEQQCKDAEQRAIEAESKCNELEQRITNEKGNFNEAEQKTAELESKFNQLEQEIAEAEQQRSDMVTKLGEVNKDKRKFERELKKMKEISLKEKQELEENKEDISELYKILHEENIVSVNLSTNNEADAGLVDKENYGLADVKLEVQKLIEKFKFEEGQHNNSEASKKDIEDKLNTSLDEKNRRIGSLEKKILDAEETLAKKIAECSRLDAELKHTKNRLNGLEKDKKKSEDDLGSELTKTRALLAQYEATKTAQADEYTKTQDEVTQLQQQLDEALTTLEKHRGDSIPRDIYDSDCAKIKQDADILKKEITKTLEKFAQMQLDIANKEQEISDLRVERNQSEAKSTKYEADVSTLKSKCHESEVQVNILRQQLTDSKHKLEKATEEINGLRKSRRDMTLRLSTKQGEINESERKKIENLKKQLENLSSHIQESEKRYRDTIAIYRGHLLAAVTGELDSDVQSALQEIIKLRVKDDDKAQTSHS